MCEGERVCVFEKENGEDVRERKWGGCVCEGERMGRVCL